MFICFSSRKVTKTDRTVLVSERVEMPALDEMDAKIIEMLEEDGRRAFNEIARKLKVNEATIRKRVLALQREGVIKQFTIKVDSRKLGLNTMAIVGVDADPTRLLEVAQKLCDFKEIRCVATSSGDHMIMLEIWTQNGKELTKVISEKIAALEGVRKVCPALLLEKLKD
jgi:Lrp/AsnC family transcriptional regulator for asnA, asnC and gidA